MAEYVVFGGGTHVPFVKSPARSTEEVLVKRGIFHNTGNAKLVLTLVTLGLLGGAFYFIALSIPETPRLGADVPRSGESIPQNRSI